MPVHSSYSVVAMDEQLRRARVCLGAAATAAGGDDGRGRGVGGGARGELARRWLSGDICPAAQRARAAAGCGSGVFVQGGGPGAAGHAGPISLGGGAAQMHLLALLRPAVLRVGRWLRPPGSRPGPTGSAGHGRRAAQLAGAAVHRPQEPPSSGRRWPARSAPGAGQQLRDAAACAADLAVRLFVVKYKERLLSGRGDERGRDQGDPRLRGARDRGRASTACRPRALEGGVAKPRGGPVIWKGTSARHVNGGILRAIETDFAVSDTKKRWPSPSSGISPRKSRELR